MQYPDFYTKEMIDISTKNNANTRKLLNVPKGYHMHHKDETLRYNDPWRYIQWLPGDLEIITNQQHRKKHAVAAGLASAEKSRGSHHTAEQNEVTSKTTKEAMWTPEVRAKQLKNSGCKKVLCVETGEVFDCIADANRKYRGHIKDCCHGRRNTASGYHWRFLDDAE